ncbi:MAG: hypothetical protein J0J04_04815 [Microbacterium sp.]|uniref:hypothetical protein n=1 Tax=Microbacterium sp. TaxID=51671 RepID=UPI001AC6AF40|nr:hypothetical protein [Microbacterium sp.]MBN9214130.1 hypothetical protein [Microbacterium sp.]
MARAATPKVKPPKVITHAPAAPGVVQAAQIALVAMKAAKVHTWAEFTYRSDQELRAAVSLTADQQGLLEDYRHILPHLQVSPLVTIAACNVCGRYGLVGSAAVPPKCGFTLRCDGAVAKASAIDYRPRSPRAK